MRVLVTIIKGDVLMNQEFEAAIYIIIHFMILYFSLAVNLYCITQYIIGKKLDVERESNFIAKLISIPILYISIRYGVYKYAFLFLSCILERYQSKRIFIICSLGILFLECFSYLGFMSDNEKKIYIFRFDLIKQILKIIQMLSVIVLVIHLFLKGIGIIDIGTVVWRIELVINLFVLISFVIISSFNLTVSSDREYMCVNNGLTQVLLVIDDSHPLKFKKNDDNSYYISNGEDSADTFVLNKEHLLTLQKYFQEELSL